MTFILPKLNLTLYRAKSKCNFTATNSPAEDITTINWPMTAVGQSVKITISSQQCQTSHDSLSAQRATQPAHSTHRLQHPMNWQGEASSFGL